MSGEGDMSENYGAIKLFGFKIPLQQPQIPDVCRQVERLCPQKSVQQENSSDSTARKPNHQENEPKQDPETVEDKIKIFKKPDKIIQCPRCDSTETKFCYFNNHNANQPRHFCKKCQRYWTAGGLLRNVPVGSGKRKKKQVASLFHHPIVTSDEISTPTLQTIYSSGYQFFSNPETSAFYWSSKDHCILLKYMHTVLNLRDQKTSAEGSSINRVSNELSPSNPVLPWLFPWNPHLKYVVSMCNPNSNFYTPTQSYDPTPLVAFPGSCPPSIPSQLASSSHWGGTLARAAGTESVSIGSNGCLWRSSSTSNCCRSGDASQTLGKHFRDTLFTDEDKSGKCILVPKTLRIDDPIEAYIRYQG